MKGIGNSGGWGTKGPGISGGGRGEGGGGIASLNFYFSRPVSIFIQLYVKSLFAFFFSTCEGKKRTHKKNIFVLVRLDILSLLEYDHFPE